MDELIAYVAAWGSLTSSFKFTQWMVEVLLGLQFEAPEMTIVFLMSSFWLAYGLVAIAQLTRRQ